jgi:dipeptide/tripeptide permease
VTGTYEIVAVKAVRAAVGTVTLPASGVGTKGTVVAIMALAIYGLGAVRMAKPPDNTSSLIAASVAGPPPGTVTGITQYSRLVVPSLRRKIAV